MTLVNRAPGDFDPTLRPVLPSFGIPDITHFYHPHMFVEERSTWVDLKGTINLPIDGDVELADGDPIQKEVFNDRPFLHLTDEASFLSGNIYPSADLGSLFLVAKIDADDLVVGNGYVLHNGSGGINMPAAGDPDVTFTNGGGVTEAQLNAWHLFSISVDGAVPPRFTVDGNSFPGNAGATLPLRIRIGSNNPGEHRSMDVAAVFSCADPVSAADITSLVYPRVKEWWPEFTWAE